MCFSNRKQQPIIYFIIWLGYVKLSCAKVKSYTVKPRFIANPDLPQTLIYRKPDLPWTRFTVNPIYREPRFTAAIPFPSNFVSYSDNMLSIWAFHCFYGINSLNVCTPGSWLWSLINVIGAVPMRSYHVTFSRAYVTMLPCVIVTVTLTHGNPDKSKRVVNRCFTALK